jgi:hypothetical protein
MSLLMVEGKVELSRVAAGMGMRFLAQVLSMALKMV